MDTVTQTKLALTIDGAKKVAAAAREVAEANNWKVCIAIVDDGGNLMYFEKMDGCIIGSIEVSVQKAMCAINFQRPSLEFSTALTNGKFSMLALRNAVPLEGGVPLTVNADIVGAIGISGVTSEEDGVIARAGASVLIPA